MANTYTYTGPGTRWTVGNPTAKDLLDLARVNTDHLHEALNAIMDTDNPELGLSLDATGDITVGDDAWIGLGASAGRIVFDSTPTPDVLSIMDAELGIGIAAPDGTLHIHTATAGSVTAGAAQDDLVIENSTHVGMTFLSPNTTQGTITWGDPEDADEARLYYDHSTDKLVFDRNSGANTYFVIDASGNVGIGTASPGEVLDVTTATDATGIIIKNTSQSPTFTMETTHANGGARNWDFITNKTNFGDWQLRVGASQGAAPGTVVMAADNAGNVGIGTASPTEALQIAGSGHKVQLVDSGDSYNLRVNLEDVPGYGGYFSLHDDSEVANVTLRSYGDSHFNGGNVFIGDTTNTNMTQGLTINQGANDDEALALKSSDVGHAMTGYAEADTYGTLKKGEATAGGLLVMGFKDADGAASAALRLQGNLGEAADTTDITASDGVVQISGNITDGGTSIAAVAATGNLVSFDNADTTRLLIKGDGALHATNITAGSGDLDGVALDGEDDIGLIRTFERTLHNNVGIMMTRWDAQIDANAEDLKRVGVLSSEGHFYNMQRMNSLLGGGIWQNHTHIMELKEALDDRDHRIALLEAQVKGLIQ